MRSRIRDAAHTLPYMPDGMEGRPPKATSDDSWKARTLEEVEERTFELLDQAITQYTTGNVLVEIKEGRSKGKVIDRGPRELAGIFGLYSGGNDSVILQHMLRRYMAQRALFRPYYRGIVHVNTGIAIKQTTQHVREVAETWGETLHELRPRVTYVDLILGNVRSTRAPNIGRPVWLGFPGPGGGGQPHNVMYMRLKDQPLQGLRRQYVGSEGIRRKVLYVAGMRWDESEKRFKNAEEINQDKAIVWVSALVHWTNAHMREYRSRYRCQKLHRHQPHRLCSDEALPLNEVTEHLHMSGDCRCGPYAKKDEKEQIRFFYPDAAAEMDAWEKAVRDAGIPACKWGTAPPTGFKQQPAGSEPIIDDPLCRKCTSSIEQGDLLDDWVDAGLITNQQRNNLRAETLEEAS